MTEAELKAILRSVTDYFLEVSGEAARVGMPYVRGAGDEVYDYTGVIGVSGSRRGAVYLTAGRGLIAEFGACILGGEALDEECLFDLIGEMANTIAGNLRQHFGSGFLISVPIVVKGRVEEIAMRLKPPVFVIPIDWRGHGCRLAVGLE